LKWPEEALVSVASKFVQKFDSLECKEEVKEELQNHMGYVHIMVQDICVTYLKRMRRNIYVTPKSYLSFIGFYKDLYLSKYNEADSAAKSYKIGLEKIREASEEIKVMGENLKTKQLKLKRAVEKTDKLVDRLKRDSLKAQKQKREVEKNTKECKEQAVDISQ
jgi:dynein heavy chain, axonemal